MAQIAFLGGTGPEGLGLALRFALAGDSVIIGSRRLDSAEHAADKVRARLAARAPQAEVRGMLNDAAARTATIAALTLPFNGVEPLLGTLAPSLAGKILLDVVNPVQLSAGLFRMIPLPAGSAAQHIQQLAPRALVVSGFKNLSAKQLWDIEQPLQGDVLLCSDIADAVQHFHGLIDRMPRLRAVDAGPLLNARHLESITTLLLNLNRRYHTTTSVQILGLDP